MKENNIEPKKDNRYSVKKIVIWSVVFGLLFILGVALTVVCNWYRKTYDLEFKELLYTLASPLKGTGQSTIYLIISSCLPTVCVFAILYIACAVFFAQRKAIFRYFRRCGAALCALVLVGSLIFSYYALRLPAYIELLSQKTTIYEEYYIDPDTVSITAEDGTAKNLIYIYLESMETTYASKDVGGTQEVYNYIPQLTELISSGVSFSDKTDSLLGGFCPVSGTTWTMAALLATTSGIPFAFPVGSNAVGEITDREYFASGLTTLGDILEDKGYRQEFLCGSDATFGGRRDYFMQHGNYEIFDLYTARAEGYIPKDYGVWWGYEDRYLYEIAKDELLELASGDQPFNFTMLTVDTHHVDGYLCEICDSAYGTADVGAERLGNVLACADRQLSEFVDWCMQQDFYEDSVIIITGDHPRMDTTLVGNVDYYYQRTIYNCFLNAAVEPEGAVEGRIWTAFDMFPTILAAMGYEIEGDCLGLGVNMFSGRQTLAEQLGYDIFNHEISKFSDYYIQEFS